MKKLTNFWILDKSITSSCYKGGTAMKRQINDMRKGLKIVIDTLWRFIDLLTLNNGKLVNISRIPFVVLNEADRLSDLGF